jgi:hypothetical protein
MKCPVCSKDMELSRTETSHNPVSGVIYDKVVYGCKADDAWITVEIPEET